MPDLAAFHAEPGAGRVEDADQGHPLLPGHLNQLGDLPDSLVAEGAGHDREVRGVHHDSPALDLDHAHDHAVCRARSGVGVARDLEVPHQRAHLLEAAGIGQQLEERAVNDGVDNSKSQPVQVGVPSEINYTKTRQVKLSEVELS